MSATPSWKRAVIYQIYPKSFKSAKNQATGDLQGIIEKLDYLAWLGVDYLWLTPIYTSPQRDNGYDISDYYTIDPTYGTMADFEQLTAQAKAHGIKIIMDIVVNHTSTEHTWFQAARQSKNNPYRDYYIWRDTPNRWQSKFGGSAWEKDPLTDQYYLHLFDKTQADLNWENPAVRQEVYKLMKFWAQKGLGGFRLDVINLISKMPGLPDDESDGRKFYTDGPKVHDYLQEMHREVFAGQHLMTVGEMSSTSLEHCIQYSRADRHELSMTFNFHHLKVDYPDGEKWALAQPDIAQLQDILSYWQKGMHDGQGWMATFWCNHDQPRAVSRFGNDTQHHRTAAKMLAITLHGLRGTPYIYQGEEIGMTNPGFTRKEDYRDIESLNAWTLLAEKGVPEAEIIQILQQKSRDNSRTPMQWDSSPFAGFSTQTPWIPLAPNAQTLNVAAAKADPDAVLHTYRKLISLRKTLPILTEGDYTHLSPGHPCIWAYQRSLGHTKLWVISNFSDRPQAFNPPADMCQPGVRTLLGTEATPPKPNAHINLKPFEAAMYIQEEANSRGS